MKLNAYEMCMNAKEVTVTENFRGKENTDIFSKFKDRSKCRWDVRFPY